jgi:hypothetical protein
MTAFVNGFLSTTKNVLNLEPTYLIKKSFGVILEMTQPNLLNLIMMWPKYFLAIPVVAQNALANLIQTSTKKLVYNMKIIRKDKQIFVF